MSNLRSERHRNSRRTGAAATEFAFCLPVLLIIVLGTIEASSMIFLKETITVAVYEGSRTALLPAATTSEVVSKCNEILSERNVSGASVTTTPTEIRTAAIGDNIMVQITAPANLNSLLPVWFSDGKTIGARCTVMKEY